jgi:hypothetical protein
MGDEIGGPQLVALQEENERLRVEVAQLVGGGGQRGRR